jgi:predicted Rdx family selenoprotein
MAEQEETKTPQALGTALPRITIQFCTQCKWMLRAAYVSLLTTFPPPFHNFSTLI